MTVQPNTQGSLDFLALWCGDEPIVLTAIIPDGGPVESETFRPKSDAEAIRAWLDERQGKRNLYFTVNPTNRAITGRNKAKKEQIRGMHALHVDIDPRPGEDLTEERARALSLLQEFKQRPTFIVDSGGGYQGFWKLDQEHRTDGDPTKTAELEAYNQQFCVLLGADNCWNIDRIMRLPGTINVPDAKKRKKGRVEALASLVEYNPEAVYPLSVFTPAPVVQTRGEQRASGGVKISGNLPKPELDKIKLNSKLKTIIVQGEDAEDLNRFPSRSETLFYVCCELVRADCDDDTIASIIMDRDLGIAASVLDKPRPMEYAARQIQRAREAVESPELVDMNDQHAVIEDLGGKVRVITEMEDLILRGRTRITRQTFDDFKNRYCHKLVQVGKRMVRQGDWWLNHPKRRQYKTMEFLPGQNVEGVYNLWKGFACEAIPGDCELFLTHIRENVCSCDAVKFEYVLNWLARMVQIPSEPGGVAIVLRGQQGTGKSFFAHTIGSLLGRHYLPISDPKHLVGNFNGHLRDCLLLFADEAFYAGDKKHESILKTLVTESTIMVENKGLDAEVARNCVHLIIASNSDWVVPAGERERRFLVLDVSDAQLQNTSYFKQLDELMNKGGREALLHLLMTRDISKFQVQNFPRTEALRDQQQRSWTPEKWWWFEKLKDGLVLEAGEGWLTEVQKMDLMADYEKFMLKRPRNVQILTPTGIGKFLAKVMPPGYPKSYQKWAERVAYQDNEARVVKFRTYFYGLPSLALAREYWDKQESSQTEWPVIEELAEER